MARDSQSDLLRTLLRSSAEKPKWLLSLKKHQPAFSDLQICFLFIPRIPFHSEESVTCRWTAPNTRQLEHSGSESTCAVLCLVPSTLQGAHKGNCSLCHPQPRPHSRLSSLSWREREGDALASETEASHAQLCSAELASEQPSHVCPRTGLDVGPPL